MVVRQRTIRARRLRRQATDAERTLWQAIRKSDPSVKIRRQHPIGPYIVDFAIPSRKLVIEVDGGQHATNRSADRRRTRELNARGYRVIRFWNREVVENLSGVLLTIASALK